MTRCPSSGSALAAVRWPWDAASALIEAEEGRLAGRTVFWLRSNLARPDLREALVAAGAQVVGPVVYCTTAVRPPGLPELVRDLDAGRVDAVTFLSPPSAENLAALEARGATLVPLSSLAGDPIPPGLGALYIGRGFPETHAATLAANRPLLDSICVAVA